MLKLRDEAADLCTVYTASGFAMFLFAAVGCV